MYIMLNQQRLVPQVLQSYPFQYTQGDLKICFTLSIFTITLYSLLSEKIDAVGGHMQRMVGILRRQLKYTGGSNNHGQGIINICILCP
jgi:hypothetical protein